MWGGFANRGHVLTASCLLIPSWVIEIHSPTSTYREMKIDISSLLRSQADSKYFPDYEVPKLLGCIRCFCGGGEVGGFESCKNY